MIQPVKTNASPFRSLLALFLFFGVTLLGVGLDLLTKEVAFSKLQTGFGVVADPSLPDGRIEVTSNEYRFIPGLLHFHVTTNQGAVFGLGRGQRWLFVVVSIVAIFVLTSLFAHSGDRWFYQLLLGMLLAGVLGNMYDRIRLGYVRDMIYGLPGWHWPGAWSLPIINYPAMPERSVFPWIFNVADSMLCVGVFLMIVYSFFQHPEPSADEPDEVSKSMKTESSHHGARQ
jgi:signal peptidase II